MRERTAAVLVAVPFLLGAAAAPERRDGEVVLEFADPQIVESSGLVVRDGLVVTVNDSGDSGRVFVVDPATGETVGTITWDGAPEDAEALAPGGDDTVWVGDIGDNAAARESVEVLRVPVGRGDQHVSPDRFELRYPDGPQDAESLLADPRTGRLVIVTKSFFGGSVYAAPLRLRADRPNPLRLVGPGVPIATDAAFLPGGRHLVIRDYVDATILSWPALEEIATFELPDQEQGEAIAADSRGRLYVSSEGQHSAVLRVALPPRVRAAMAAPTAPTAPSAPATPRTDVPQQPSAADAAGSGTPRWALAGAGALVLLVAAGALARRRR